LARRRRAVGGQSRAGGLRHCGPERPASGAVLRRAEGGNPAQEPCLRIWDCAGTSGGSAEQRYCDGAYDPVYSTCCAPDDPCGWADDGRCDCGGACAWEPECAVVSPGGPGGL
ncbi:MAG: hypothetical protein FJ104_04300, partial [Deltaproteobacteria bacterium]|nr:hypothetical protein [Deltaproteobacteria bacterium]